MSKLIGKTYFNDNWLIDKEYSAQIKNATTMDLHSTATGVAKKKKSCSPIWVDSKKKPYESRQP